MSADIKDWEVAAASDKRLLTYQLYIQVGKAQSIRIGRLGTFRFPAGHYIYTGSARRHLAARVRRHLSTDKKLRWHIDYLLTARTVRVNTVGLSASEECHCHQCTRGEIVVPGFGASDCTSGCGSHLKFLGMDFTRGH